MPAHERDTQLSPFPRLPASLRDHSPAAGPLHLRPFGLDAGDLEVDFREARPLVVTAILALCARDAEGGRPGEEFLWGLPVSTRIECLLSLATGGGREQLLIPLLCPQETCAQQCEVELTLTELGGLGERDGGSERFMVRRGAEELWVRKPTGGDQLAWLNRTFADGAEALEAMAGALALDRKGAPLGAGRLDGAWALAFDEALDEFDPLVNFHITARCPECGVESAHEVDLEALALGLLRRAQQRLLLTVHRLASHYHWSESQIFSVPHWRRSHYLALIEREDRR
jgi:hypothetical protein